jgi:hypothetical protein
MKGCGCSLAIITGILGLFFWPLWLLTIAGIILYGFGNSGKKE